MPAEREAARIASSIVRAFLPSRDYHAVRPFGR